MIRWLMLFTAVLANVATNIALKKFVISSVGNSTGLFAMIFDPWLMLGVITGFVLLGSYIFAIAHIDLEVAYAVVTTGSLIILAGLAPLIFGTGFSMVRLAGVALAVAGIGLIVYSQVATD